LGEAKNSEDPEERLQGRKDRGETQSPTRTGRTAGAWGCKKHHRTSGIIKSDFKLKHLHKNSKRAFNARVFDEPAPRWSERNQDLFQNWHAESALQWFRW